MFPDGHSEPNHTFQFDETLIAQVNARMDKLPEWKRANFNQRYFAADEEFLSDSLTLKKTDRGLAVYLRNVYEDERSLERVLRACLRRGFRRGEKSDSWDVALQDDVPCHAAAAELTRLT